MSFQATGKTICVKRTRQRLPKSRLPIPQFYVSHCKIYSKVYSPLFQVKQRKGAPLVRVNLEGTETECTSCPCGQKCLYTLTNTTENTITGSKYYNLWFCNVTYRLYATSPLLNFWPNFRYYNFHTGQPYDDCREVFLKYMFLKTNKFDIFFLINIYNFSKVARAHEDSVHHIKKIIYVH